MVFSDFLGNVAGILYLCTSKILVRRCSRSAIDANIMALAQSHLCSAFRDELRLSLRAAAGE